MNRKERRAALKHDKRLTVPAPASNLPQKIDELAAEARRHFDLRHFAPAQKLCKGYPAARRRTSTVSTCSV
jgi:hypothetical protein